MSANVDECMFVQDLFIVSESSPTGWLLYKDLGGKMYITYMLLSKTRLIEVTCKQLCKLMTGNMRVNDCKVTDSFSHSKAHEG